MKLTVSDSNNLPKDNSRVNLDDHWFERDKVASELQALIDPTQEFVERTKILAAIRLGMMIDEDEMERPPQTVILEETQAMQDLDKILAEYNAAHPKLENPAPPVDTKIDP